MPEVACGSLRSFVPWPEGDPNSVALMLGWIGKTQEFRLFFADLQIKGQTLYRFSGLSWMPESGALAAIMIGFPDKRSVLLSVSPLSEHAVDFDWVWPSRVEWNGSPRLGTGSRGHGRRFGLHGSAGGAQSFFRFCPPGSSRKAVAPQPSAPRSGRGGGGFGTGLGRQHVAAQVTALAAAPPQDDRRGDEHR